MKNLSSNPPANHNHNRARPRRRYDYSGIYRWIVKYASRYHGQFPSYEEIQAEFCIPSKSTVDYIITRLCRGGLIDRDKAGKRRYYIVGAQWTPPERV